MHHNLKTGYSDYKEFLRKTYNHSFEKFENFPYVNFDVVEKWSDLELSLKLDYKYFIEEVILDVYPDLMSESDYKCYDFDIELEQETKFIYDFTGLYFYEWLSEIDYLSVFADLEFNGEDKFITFNYTSTLERLYEVFQENIYYIHGRLDNIETRNFLPWIIPSFNTIEEAEVAEQYQSDEHNNAEIRAYIQFGSVENDGEFIKKNIEKTYSDNRFYVVSIEPAVNRLIEFCNATFKDLKSNYELLNDFVSSNDFDEVVIMGHSIMGVDLDYYTDIIIPKLMKKKWIFYYYNDMNLQESKDFVEMFELENYEFINW